MNKKGITKILTILMIAIFLVSIAATCFAIEPSDVTRPSGTISGEDKIGNVGNALVGILQTVGIVLSVIILIVLGIKYMMGSSEEKAEYKKTMMPYVIGAALIFAASALAQVIYSFFTGITAG